MTKINKNIRIITCAVTGSIHTPTMSPYLPITTEQIAQAAIDAANAGAASVHIHARNPENGMPSSNIEHFREIVTKIRSRNKDVIICITTGGGTGMTIEQRSAVIPTFKPELASLNMGSINWGLFSIADKIKDWKYDWEKPMFEMSKKFVFQNTFEDMENILRTMNENNTKPELECYDVGHLYTVKYLMENQQIIKKPFLQFVMGITGAIDANPHELVHMKQTADRIFGSDGYEWSAFGAGRFEYPICTQNLFLGGHVRVGMEDNLFLSKGKIAENNGQLVEKMVRIMGEFDYKPATPDEARMILDIQ